MIDDSKLRVAILIDCENIPFEHFQQIKIEASSHGRVIIKRCYADFGVSSPNSWRKMALDEAIHTVHVSRQVQGKNSSDISLVIDGLKLLYEKQADIFCIVSSDSDFTALAIAIREKGNKVIGMGLTSAIPSFRNSCDEFVILANEEKAKAGAKKNESIALTSTSVSPEKSIPKNIVNMILSSVETLSSKRDDGYAHIGELGTLIRRIDTGFNLKKLGCASLSSLLKKMNLFEFDPKNNQLVRPR